MQNAIDVDNVFCDAITSSSFAADPAPVRKLNRSANAIVDSDRYFKGSRLTVTLQNVVADAQIRPAILSVLVLTTRLAWINRF